MTRMDQACKCFLSIVYLLHYMSVFGHKPRGILLLAFGIFKSKFMEKILSKGSNKIKSSVENFDNREELMNIW